jgi:hypothetical protein
MSNTKPCPICEQALTAHAEVSAGGVETFVGQCTLCGRFALGRDELALAAAMSDGDRYNLMARLETRSIAAEADGTVVLRPHHFKKGAKDPGLPA